MAWTFDAASGTGGITEVDADATVTLSFTVGTLASGILWVGAAWATTATTVSGCTYNGVALTEDSTQATNRGVWLGRLYNPTAGANNIVLSGSGNFGRVCMGAISYDGANATQTPQVPTTTSGNSTTPSITSLTGATEIVIDCVGISFTAGDTLTVGADQTERVKITGGATTLAMSSQLGSAGGAMTWTDSNTRAWGQVAASYDAAAAAGVVIPVFMNQYKQRVT